MERLSWPRRQTRPDPGPPATLPASLEASRPVPADPSGIRLSFGRYMVHRELALGSVSRVLLAEDPLARRAVAIKTVRWEYVTSDNASYCLARLDRQAHTAGRLCHAHIVKVFDRGSDFLVMEYLEGLKLSTILRDRGRLDPDAALQLLAPLAAAVDHMHVRGVVHRDLKPANVIVLADGSPKLIDFGASCTADQSGETWDRYLGTPSHMAPEQVLHGTANALTDLFSFGVLAYELLTGQAPFRGDSVGAITYRVVYEDAPPPTRWFGDLPRAYDEIFARMLAKDPAQRLPSAGAFVRALQSSRDRRRRLTDRSLAALAEGPAPLETALDGAAGAGCVVEVRSEPTGAEVSWNGVLRGLTPLSICETGPGPHRLQLQSDGYTPVEAAFMLPDAPSLRLQFSMVPAPPSKVLEFRPSRRDA